MDIFIKKSNRELKEEGSLRLDYITVSNWKLYSHVNCVVDLTSGVKGGLWVHKFEPKDKVGFKKIIQNATPKVRGDVKEVDGPTLLISRPSAYTKGNIHHEIFQFLFPIYRTLAHYGWLEADTKIRLIRTNHTDRLKRPIPVIGGALFESKAMNCISHDIQEIKKNDCVKLKNCVVGLVKKKDIATSEFNAFRDWLLKKLKITRVKKPNKILVVQRQRRSITNLKDVKRLLIELKLSFEICDFEGLTYYEQVKKTASSLVFLSPHGAAMCNLMFLPDGAWLYEGHPLRGRLHLNYRRRCKLLHGKIGHRYVPLVRNKNTIPRKNEDMTFDLKWLEENLKNIKSWKKDDVLNVPALKSTKKLNKIFLIGFNRCGTRSFHRLFCDMGLKSCHGRGENRKNIQKAAKEKKPILAYINSDLQCYGDLRLWKYFKELDKQYPNSKFILNTRNIENWIKSRKKHYGANYYNNDIYHGIVMDEKVWRNDWFRHNKNVKEYFKNRPQDLLIFDVEVNNFDKIANFFNIDTKKHKFLFRHMGKTKSKPSKKFYRILRSLVKFFKGT